MNPYRSLVTAAILLIFTASSSHGKLIILGNLPQENDALSAAIDAGTDNVGTNFQSLRNAISLTMPSQSYPVDEVTLRLFQYDTTAGDVAAVGLYGDNGNNFPGALVGSLLTSPPSSSNNLGSFKFTPASPLTLAASTKYWLVVAASAGAYQWQGTHPPKAPSSEVGASFGNYILLVDDSAEVVTDRLTSFEIVDVPEPSAVILFATAATALGVIRRRYLTH